ncbi:D-alanyl-D-alanine carboxypeptidase [Rhodobacter veldkampii DSM 11550]|uniref:serine-type D-Ala-D-Ala carboxypeptidase n=1 Tax=Phaeovulum veldkampii DSM 11550 TaxID=1185920 RepID=A0A2T4JHK6_9RHOB|nr:D-alanyl-D-alanine carboxypeptidase family protein [Phaeovulum veldkampii]MBK5946207.1 D-alanyl-D-alanine carboxypeptidase [Phaeovulum veldkampii DSM 11550]PTE17376.1 D-alanyl-D-alanine carboxypeptidase [Phaeovulum veldkampii DSM 11550]TDQ56600.1 D-alanyl-D-alanine carboxypeptidase (penicillin-binding protein 5/6) [Phaeovulum veldkampii DSM 11550]
MTLPSLRPLLALLLTALLVTALPARAFETRASAAWVYDVGTDTVLLEKNADVTLPPASMSKLMTLNMLFEALRDGRVTMDTQFSVSTRAKEMGGSTMFLNEMDRPTVDQLIHGIIVNSGNDACVVVAEGLAGSEEAFARLMTERARALGMTNSIFANASGWPDPGHRMSMHDLGVLARRLIVDFPEFYPIFSETEYNFENRAPANSLNRNPLLRLGSGDWKADGLKTGHTSEAGYGLVGSAVQGGRRVIFVITGLDSEATRAQEAEQIVNWAFRQFVVKTLAKAGTKLAEAPVWLGAAPSVGLVPATDLQLLLPALAHDGVTAEAVFSGPVTAPIAAGQELGQLVVTVPGMAEHRVPLVAEAAVAEAGFADRVKTAGQRLIARALVAAER